MAVPLAILAIGAILMVVGARQDHQAVAPRLPAAFVVPHGFTAHHRGPGLAAPTAHTRGSAGTPVVDLAYSYPASLTAPVAEDAVMMQLSLRGWRTWPGPTRHDGYSGAVAFSGFGFDGVIIPARGALDIVMEPCGVTAGRSCTS